MIHLSFKARIYLCVGMAILLSLSTTNYLAYKEFEKNIASSANSYSMLVLDSQAKAISAWIRAKQSLVTASAEFLANNPSSEMIIANARQMVVTGQLEEAYIGYEDGSAYTSQKGLLDASSYDPRVRPWYADSKQTRQLVVTDVYADALTGNNVMSIGMPIIINGQFSGSVLADISLAEITKRVQSIQFKGGYALLFDQKGKALADFAGVKKDGSLSGSDPELRSLEKAMISQNSGSLEYQLNGDNKVGFFNDIELGDGKKWKLLVTVNQEVVYEELNEAVSFMLLSTLGFTILGVAITILVLNILYRPILVLKQMIQDLAGGEGDLTRRLKVTSKDDLGQIAQGVNTFIGNLQSMLKEVCQSTGSIASNIDQISNITQANQQVLDRHSSETEQVVSAVTEMSATASSVANSTADAASHTQQAAEESSASQKVVNHAVDNVQSLVEQVDHMAQRIQTMHQDTLQISSVLNVIGDIAEQTNLLALNAAIEAARAGDQGRGFAVVADEVRALAARTQKSTAEINSMLDQLNQASSSVENAMGSTRQSCQSTAESTAEVTSSLTTINHTISNINNLNIQVATAAEEQSAVADEINRNLVNIRNIVVELNSRGGETGQCVENLVSTNQQLEQLIGKFKLD